jgi:hypothetical protein
MSCKCAYRSDEGHGWGCEVSGSACMFIYPDSKACAEKYGEGPEAPQEKCEDCGSFYMRDGKRCCKEEPLGLWNRKLEKFEKSPFIQEDVISCGAWNKKNK